MLKSHTEDGLDVELVAYNDGGATEMLAEVPPEHHDVVSPGSCGVNALTVMAKVLLDRFGLHAVSTSVFLAVQGWGKVQDSVIGTSRTRTPTAS